MKGRMASSTNPTNINPLNNKISVCLFLIVSEMSCENFMLAKLMSAVDDCLYKSADNKIYRLKRRGSAFSRPSHTTYE